MSGTQAGTGAQQGEQDDELTIPRAAMNKMIKELLPNIRVANEARELVLNCCTEFIHLISSESNDICNQQQKKTISAEHVLAAQLVRLLIVIVFERRWRCQDPERIGHRVKQGAAQGRCGQQGRLGE